MPVRAGLVSSGEAANKTCGRFLERNSVFIFCFFSLLTSGGIGKSLASIRGNVPFVLYFQDSKNLQKTLFITRVYYEDCFKELTILSTSPLREESFIRSPETFLT